MINTISLRLILLAVSTLLIASVTQVPGEAEPSHDLWNQLLSDHVDRGGLVDYEGIQQDMGSLDRYLQSLAENPPQEDWSRVEKLAYWINAYNAFTVKLIADNYPLSSIMDLDDGKVWDKRTLGLGGKEYTLNEMEHIKLRGEIGDPRIHFAINCAAISCPPIHNEAFTAGNVERLLGELTREFILNEEFNDISPGRIELSKVFQWYAEDFGDLIAFLNQYTAHPIHKDATIIYREYNWELND